MKKYCYTNLLIFLTLKYTILSYKFQYILHQDNDEDGARRIL